MTWRNEIPIHPAADLFPLLNERELRALGQDIRKNGLTCAPVFTLIKNRPVLVDGRNRLDAMEMVGLSVKFESKGGWVSILVEDPDGHRMSGSCQMVPTKNVTEYIRSVNVHRRHLTAEQKRETIEKLLKVQPEKSDRQIAEQVKASPSTVGNVRRELEENGDVSKLDTRTDTKGRKQRTRKKAKRAPDAARPERKMSERDKALDKLMEIMQAVGVLAGLQPPEQMVRHFSDNGLVISESDREQIRKASEWLDELYIASAPFEEDDALEVEAPSMALADAAAPGQQSEIDTPQNALAWFESTSAASVMGKSKQDKKHMKHMAELPDGSRYSISAPVELFTGRFCGYTVTYFAQGDKEGVVLGEGVCTPEAAKQIAQQHADKAKATA